MPSLSHKLCNDLAEGIFLHHLHFQAHIILNPYNSQHNKVLARLYECLRGSMQRSREPAEVLQPYILPAMAHPAAETACKQSRASSGTHSVWAVVSLTISHCNAGATSHLTARTHSHATPFRASIDSSKPYSAE